MWYIICLKCSVELKYKTNSNGYCNTTFIADGQLTKLNGGNLHIVVLFGIVLRKEMWLY